ncbi:MAG: hypothetical protein K0S42_3046, partial [Microvirga sp.]|nr:hypothetical protein [Microvirga sp.]
LEADWPARIVDLPESNIGVAVAERISGTKLDEITVVPGPGMGQRSLAAGHGHRRGNGGGSLACKRHIAWLRRKVVGLTSRSRKKKSQSKYRDAATCHSQVSHDRWTIRRLTITGPWRIAGCPSRLRKWKAFILRTRFPSRLVDRSPGRTGRSAKIGPGAFESRKQLAVANVILLTKGNQILRRLHDVGYIEDAAVIRAHRMLLVARTQAVLKRPSMSTRSGARSSLSQTERK